MRGKSALLAVILILAIVLSIIGGAFLILSGNYLIDFRLYPKNAASMDLREEDVSIAHYEALHQKLPKCKILWNVPFQNGKLSSDTAEITVDTLSSQDVETLAYFPKLETVHAESCRDYDNLALLRQRYPNLTVSSCVVLDGIEYPADAESVELKTASPENLSMLPLLTNLHTVTVANSEGGQDFSALSAYCRENDLNFQFHIGGELVDANVQELTVENITDADLSLLDNLSELKTLRMVDPAADPAALASLSEQYPNVDISWEVRIGDNVFQSTDTEVDLSQTVVTDLAEVEAKMEYLPNVEKVIFGLCGKFGEGLDNPDWGNSKAKVVACDIANEDMAAYRDRVRDKYKVVWTVRLGPSIALQKFVVEKGLDIGFAYDGDADRCLCVDEKGNVITGDHILYIYGCYMKERGKLLTNTVVTTVMSNFGLYKALDAVGIEYEKTAVGECSKRWRRENEV